MNRPEHELADTIVQYLEHGVDRLEPRVRERLASARRDALSRYREQPAPVFGLAWAGHAAVWLTEHPFRGARLLIAAAAFAAATAGIVYWQSSGPSANGLADIDFYLLTDELPINAYLDKGFDSWLKRSSR